MLPQACFLELIIEYVLEIEIADLTKVTIIVENKTERNAEAIVKMAVMRRGVEKTFFTVVPHGKRAQEGGQS